MDNKELLIAKDYPVTTNRLKIKIKLKEFFKHYSIVSYSNNEKNKNVPYEELCEIPTISVTSIKKRWNIRKRETTKYFVLCKNEDSPKILQHLREYENVIARLDNLEGYDIDLQNRIIVSLAINSLGKKRNGKMMYNNASLIVSDDKNFCINEKHGMICLKIELNKYMVLSAKTMTFSNPKDFKELETNQHYIFQEGREIDGQYSSGQVLKPVLFKKIKGKEIDLKKIFIRKKKNKHLNIVPYWHYNPENYIHSKLFVLWTVMDKLKKEFKEFIDVDFTDYPIVHFDELDTRKETDSLIKTYFADKNITFENPFQSLESTAFIDEIKEKSILITEAENLFSERGKSDSMVIKLCEPIEEGVPNIYYSQSKERAIQHVCFDINSKNSISLTVIQRIMIELIVKDSFIKRILPQSLYPLIQGWKFIRYKINEGFVHGATMKVNSNMQIEFKEYGLTKNPLGEDFEDFVMKEFDCNAPDEIKGEQDYKVMVKNGNIYIIIDTDEIPILDAPAIDEKYKVIINGTDPRYNTIALFKRKKEEFRHKYLRGYQGFHLWKTDGLYGEQEGAYSYISGKVSQHEEISDRRSMEKMPRARRIFILDNQHPENIENEIMEIVDMLKSGFGRMNEMMTYPFPFKFLQEYLDNASELAFSKHWIEISRNTKLF